MVYLLKQERRNGSYFKIGYTSNLMQRLTAYATHLADYEIVATVKTYGKTKHQLETAIHKEILDMGYHFKVDENTGIKSEWFFVDIDHEKEFQQGGLYQFKCCKGRKIVLGG